MTTLCIIGWALFALMTGVAWWLYGQWREAIRLASMESEMCREVQRITLKLMQGSELMLEPEDQNWRNN